MANKLFNNVILLVLLLMGCLFGTRNSRSAENVDTNVIGDIESDYLKIFSDIKQLRSKVPNYPSPDITFEPEKAYLLLQDPINFKRTSIINPDEGKENTFQNTTEAGDNTFSDDMFANFQKREDDPLHRKHGVGEGLAALPESVVNKHPSAFSIIKSSENTNLHSDVVKSNNDIESKNTSSTSLGMVPEDKSLKKLHISPKMDEVMMKKEDLELKGKKRLHISPKLFGKMEVNDKIKKGINESNEEISDSKSNGISENHGIDIPLLRNTFGTVKELKSLKKNILTEQTPNILLSKNNTSSLNSSTNKTKMSQRNMIVDAQIKGFLAKLETFNFNDVGTNKEDEFQGQNSADIPTNNSLHEPISSNLESKISHRSNITHDNISSNIESKMSDTLNNTHAVANSSKDESKVFDKSNETHAGLIPSNLESKMSDTLNNTHAAANSSKEESKMFNKSNETHGGLIPSNLESKMSDTLNNTHAAANSSKDESKVFDKSNETHAGLIPSNLESKMSDTLNNTHAAANSSKEESKMFNKSNETHVGLIPSNLESKMSDTLNNTHTVANSSKEESKVFDKSNETHAEPISSNLESKLSDKLNNRQAETNSSKVGSKMFDDSNNSHAKHNLSNLESKISGKPNNTHAKTIPSNLENKTPLIIKKYEGNAMLEINHATTAFQPHLWRQTNHLLHLATVADELKDKLDTSSILSKKKDVSKI